MRAQRTVIAPLIFSLSMTSIASCSSCSHKSSGESPAIVEAPVAAPPALLGELTIENPDAFWSRLQRGIGGFAGLMPTTLGGLVASFGSIDTSIGPIIDGASPAYAAAVARGADEIGWTIAVRFTDLPHARVTLLDGPAAKYDGTEDGDFTLLAFKGGTVTPGAPQIAVSKTGYLLFGATRADIDEIGPYLVRTMPTHPRATTDVELDVPRTALAGPLHDRAAAAWTSFEKEKESQALEAQQKHGRPPDFGDPIGILSAADGAMQKRLALLADLQSAHLSLEATGTSFTIDAILTPNEGNGPASQWTSGMQNGDLSPLLDAGVGPATIVSRSNPADRASAADEFQTLLQHVMGDRLTDADAKLAHAALADWESAAGDYFVASIATDPTPSLILRTPTTHADVAARSIHEGCELLERPVFNDLLASTLKTTGHSFGNADVAGVGAATTFILKRGATTAVSAAWLTKDGTFDLAASSDGALSLGTLGHPARSWRDDAEVGPHALAVGENASFALASRPFPGTDPAASLLLFWGRQGSHVHGGAFGSDVILREAIRHFGR